MPNTNLLPVLVEEPQRSAEKLEDGHGAEDLKFSGLIAQSVGLFWRFAGLF